MKSFRDPVTDVLQAWGNVDSNGSDVARDESDDFSLEPGKWRLVGDQWVAIQPDHKAAKWEQIKAERDRRKAGGVKVGDKWFHSDADSRIQQLGLVMFGVNVPPIQWKTMDGSFVEMSQTLANQIFQAIAAADQAIFAVAEQHRAAMEASSDPENYDFSGGWPAIYGEGA